MNITISKIFKNETKQDGTPFVTKNGNRYTSIKVYSPELEAIGHKYGKVFGWEGDKSLTWNVGDTVEVIVEPSNNPQYPEPTLKPMTQKAKAEASQKEFEKELKALRESVDNLASNVWAKLSDLEYMTNRHEDLFSKKDAVSTVEIKTTPTASSTLPKAPEVKPWHKPLPSQKAAEETFNNFEV